MNKERQRSAIPLNYSLSGRQAEILFAGVCELTRDRWRSKQLPLMTYSIKKAGPHSLIECGLFLLRRPFIICFRFFRAGGDPRHIALFLAPVFMGKTNQAGYKIPCLQTAYNQFIWARSDRSLAFFLSASPIHCRRCGLIRHNYRYFLTFPEYSPLHRPPTRFRPDPQKGVRPAGMSGSRQGIPPVQSTGVRVLRR